MSVVAGESGGEERGKGAFIYTGTADGSVGDDDGSGGGDG